MGGFEGPKGACGPGRGAWGQLISECGSDLISYRARCNSALSLFFHLFFSFSFTSSLSLLYSLFSFLFLSFLLSLSVFSDSVCPRYDGGSDGLKFTDPSPLCSGAEQQQQQHKTGMTFSTRPRGNAQFGERAEERRSRVQRRMRSELGVRPVSSKVV